MPTLSWLTRDEDIKAAERVPYRLLERDPTLSAGEGTTSNMLIQGDNLEALKSLLPYYAGQVKCIYIDPPYNTRSAVSVLYDDNLEHTQWLGLMLPRLSLLKELLADDGLLFVQIDDNEQAYLTIILDEIFGRSNRLNTIAVKMSEATGVKMAHASKRLPKMKETILVYKKRVVPQINPPSIPLGAWNEEYKEIIEGVSRDDLETIKDIVRQDIATEDDVRRVNTLIATAKIRSLAQVRRELGLDDEAFDAFRWDNAWRIIQAVGAGSLKAAAQEVRQKGQDISAVLSARSKLSVFKTDFNTNSRDPRIRILFADFYLTYNPGDFWTDIKTTGGVGREGGVDFPNGKKPEQLISRVLSLCTSEGDLILDSFLGSGTTAAVAHKMKRRYIGIEMGEHAVSHCAPRLRNVIEGEQGGISEIVGWEGGGGFAFYRLGEPVFDGEGRIQPGIGFASLAAHVWFSETGLALANTALRPQRPEKPFLGVHDGRGYALLYNGVLGDRRPQGGNVLTNATLAIIREAADGFAGPMTVYGEASRLNGARLRAEGVSFKQTPYDVKAR